MSQLPNVVIVMSRCSRHRESYGIRLEEISRGMWSADWAFPVKETIAKKEGYDRSEIKGIFIVADEYPGCPYCKNKGIILCGCDKVSCYDNRSPIASCAWCGTKGQIGVGSGVTGLKAGGDL